MAQLQGPCKCSPLRQPRLGGTAFLITTGLSDLSLRTHHKHAIRKSVSTHVTQRAALGCISEATTNQQARDEPQHGSSAGITSIA